MQLTLEGLPVTRSDLQYRTPGDTEMRSLDSSGSQILGRSPGFFSGFLTVGGNFPDELREGILPVVPLHETENYLRGQIELLLVQLRDPGQTFALHFSDARAVGVWGPCLL